MYKDDLWYRKLLRVIEEHRLSFTEKQWRYRIDSLRLALRVKETSTGVKRAGFSAHAESPGGGCELPAPGASATRKVFPDGEHFVKEHLVRRSTTAPLCLLRLNPYAHRHGWGSCC